MNSVEFSFLYLYQFKFSFYTPCGFAHSKFTRHFCTRSYFVIKHSYVIIKFWQWWILIIYKRLKNVRKYRTAVVHMCMNCFDDIWWMIFVHSYLKAMLKWILQLFWWSNRGEKDLSKSESRWGCKSENNFFLLKVDCLFLLKRLYLCMCTLIKSSVFILIDIFLIDLFLHTTIIKFPAALISVSFIVRSCTCWVCMTESLHFK